MKKWVKKEWNAEKIMDELEALHPDFFPRATKLTREPYGFKAVQLEDRMTKSALRDLYIECGRYLHRGSAKKLLKEKMPAQVQFPGIR